MVKYSELLACYNSASYQILVNSTDILEHLLWTRPVVSAKNKRQS